MARFSVEQAELTKPNRLKITVPIKNGKQVLSHQRQGAPSIYQRRSSANVVIVPNGDYIW
jgi:hypothetical protein